MELEGVARLLCDDVIAFLVYAVEEAIYNIEPYNESFQDNANRVNKALHAEYKNRGLDHDQFVADIKPAK